ncbi:MAG: hypothetical protein JWL92_355 [Candidatus Nomurabacteria bacterium]|nr:hypothetical protein [Candidatus Nomurabacteria bacterium]
MHNISKTTLALFAIGAFVLLLTSFSLGQAVGYRKASFAFQNGNSFYKISPHGGPMIPAGDFSDAHGSAGTVLSIVLPTIVIQDRDNTEKTVLLNDKTAIRRFRDSIKAEDIAVGDQVVAIGEPNDQSQIVATLIRIIPKR